MVSGWSDPCWQMGVGALLLVVGTRPACLLCCALPLSLVQQVCLLLAFVGVGLMVWAYLAMRAEARGYLDGFSEDEAVPGTRV